MEEDIGDRERHLAKCLAEYAREKGIKFGSIKVEATFKNGTLITFRVGQEQTHQNIKF